MEMTDLNKERFQILNFQIHLLEVKKVFDVFEEQSLSPILIKGLSTAVNYPKPYQRNFSDIDLAVSPESFEKAESIIEQNNFNIDLHKGLRHLDVLKWDDLYKNSRLIEIDKIKIRVLRPEDNLRVLCVHWLTDGGADRSRLWDIYFAISNKTDSFDWDRFFCVVDDKRRIWLSVVLLTAQEYLGLQLDETVSRLYLDELPDWIKRQLESEWSSDNRLIPLKKVILKDGKAFYQQILKRFPPNILQGIVETNSDMKRDRFHLTGIRGFITRAKNSAKDLLKIIGGK